MRKHMLGRTIVYIDGENFTSTVRELGFKVCFKRLLKKIESLFPGLIRVNYYTAVLQNGEESKKTPKQSFVDWISYNGYNLIVKHAKEFSGGIIKGNVDVDLAVDAMSQLDVIDHLVLFSGDGDFLRLIEHAQARGVYTTVVSSTKTNPSILADELRKRADEFIEIETLKQSVRKLRLTTIEGEEEI